jgi:chemotaxis protein methyltransferase CheR
MEEVIENINCLIKEKYSFDISIYDDSFLEKTICKRMKVSFCNTISDYMLLLNHNPSETSIMIDSLNNKYSEFFRNQLTFLMLERFILPKIISEKDSAHGDEIRIWSAGCAAGQEPYSIAILVDDYKNYHKEYVDFRIFATDKCGKNLQAARNGIYHCKAIQNTRFINVLKYFSNSGEFYSINESIRKMVDFSVFDLLEKQTVSPPASIYGGFDIVMCSNLLFYYKPEKQRIILSKLAGSLTRGGFPITGEAETEIVRSYRGFKQFIPPAAIFVKT